MKLIVILIAIVMSSHIKQSDFEKCKVVIKLYVKMCEQMAKIRQSENF